MERPGAKFTYLYNQEPFHVRLKEFWPLTAARKVLASFIQNLSHESDGLILQVCILFLPKQQRGIGLKEGCVKGPRLNCQEARQFAA